MDADLSHLLEQALQYATPLPTPQAEHVPLEEILDRPSDTPTQQVNTPVNRCDVGCMTDDVIILDSKQMVPSVSSTGQNNNITTSEDSSQISHIERLVAAPLTDLTSSSASIRAGSISHLVDSSVQSLLRQSVTESVTSLLPRQHSSQYDPVNFVLPKDKKSLSQDENCQTVSCDSSTAASSHEMVTSPAMVSATMVTSAMVTSTPNVTSTVMVTSPAMVPSPYSDISTDSPSTSIPTTASVENMNTCVSDSSSEGSKRKQKRKREKLTCSPPPIVLPPCRICDDKSSGYHYGANTCEACKGFFRRTLKKSSVTFKCKCTEEERVAWQQGPSKNGCPACRYKRCLAVGMSRNAIKIGRYTLDHKTDNIKEVKSLEAMDTVIHDAIAAESPLSPWSLASPRASEMSPSSSTTTDSPRPSTATTDLSEQEMSDMIAACHQAHQTYLQSEKLPAQEELYRTQISYVEMFMERQKTFGNMKPLSREECIDFYTVTGMDLDGRIGKMEDAIEFFQKKISFVVQFAKSIPGFNQLSLDDQASLIKASRLESMLIGMPKEFAKRINFDLQVVTTPWGNTHHFTELGAILPLELIIERFHAKSMLQSLQLTDQEVGVFRAFVITASDRCDLEGGHKVEEIHQKLLSCLLHLLQSRPGGATNIFQKLISLMTLLRTINNNDLTATKKMLMDWPMLANYELFRELIG